MDIKYLLSSDGPVLITPKIFKDERGYFYESFNLKEFEEKVGKINFVQDNESKSAYGVVRGLHFQAPPYDQAKLVRVAKGLVYDVAVDIRKGSCTYGMWCGAFLSEQNHRQLFIPRGFAHGFISLSDETIFQYKCDNFYDKESEGGLMFNDPEIGIFWDEFIPEETMIVSDKDKQHQSFIDFKSPFIYTNDKDNLEILKEYKDE